MTRHADALFAALGPVVDGLARTFGRSCEVVLHDYRAPDRSVVAVAGDVTGRRPGDAMSQIGLRVLAAGDDARNDLNYVTRTQTGRLLKCSTMPLHDEDGHLIGALCVNIDTTALTAASAVLADLAGSSATATPTSPTSPTSTTFSGDLEELIDSVLAAAQRDFGAPPEGLPRTQRLQLLEALKTAGVFALRGAPVRVAARLGISRAALYKDLRSLDEHDSAAERSRS